MSRHVVAVAESILGPIAGGPFLEDDAKLRAVHLNYWKKICPKPVTVWTQDVNKIIAQDNPTALTILNAWIKHLGTIEDPCLQIDGGVDRIFDV